MTMMMVVVVMMMMMMMMMMITKIKSSGWWCMVDEWMNEWLVREKRDKFQFVYRS